MERHRAQPGTRPSTPQEAWACLEAGNIRFMAGERAHPHQDVQLRHRLANKQMPFAVFFGCADSRVAAEIIFDQGLGDLFVVRTAGHVIDSSVIGSIEFAVGMLDVHLVVVLGHDSCGAIKAAVTAVETGDMPTGYIRDIVERVTPSVLTARKRGETSTYEIEAEHVRNTAWLLASRSTVVADKLAEGTLAIVGATYRLREGQANIVESLGMPPPAAPVVDSPE